MRISQLNGISTLGIAFTLAAVLTACGGGGGGGSVPGGGMQTVTPTNTAAPAATGNVTGTVVDEASNTPLSGVTVSLGAWTAGAALSQVATTNSSGQFGFNANTGSYMLVVGSNSPTDTRATLHVGIVVSSGQNTLALPQPSPYPDVTYAPSQTSGNFRLMALSSVQQDCLAGANTPRGGSSGLPLLVPDEFLEEDAIADNAEEDAQATDTPSPLFGFTQPFGSISGGSSSIGFSPCDSWTNSYSYTNGNPPYSSATNASNVWYGAIIDETNNPHYGSQLWATNSQGVGTASKARSTLSHTMR